MNSKHTGVIVAQTLTEHAASKVQGFKEETLLHEISGGADSLAAPAVPSSSPWILAEMRSSQGGLASAETFHVCPRKSA